MYVETLKYKNKIESIFAFSYNKTKYVSLKIYHIYINDYSQYCIHSSLSEEEKERVVRERERERKPSAKCMDSFV